MILNNKNIDENGNVDESSSLFTHINFDGEKNEIIDKLREEPFLANINIDNDKTIITNFLSISAPTKYTKKFRIAQTLIIKPEVQNIGLSAYDDIENLIYLGSEGLPNFKFWSKYNNVISNVIFIDSGFLSGSMFLLEGCTYIIKNFEYFLDKNNFIRILKSNTKKIKKLLQDLLDTESLIIIKFLVDNNLVTYNQIYEFVANSLNTEAKLYLVDVLDSMPDVIKEEHKKIAERKENLELGLTNYTLSDLRKDFACTKKEDKIYLSNYKQNNSIIIIPSNVDGISKYVIKGLGKNSKVEKIFFEEGIKSIECLSTSNRDYNSIDKFGFFGFENLKEIILPSTLEYIDPELLLFSSKYSMFIRSSIRVISNNITNNKNVILHDDMLIQNNEIIYFNFNSINKEKLNREKINIPNYINHISDNMFRDICEIKEVVLPSGLTSIGNSAFEDCINLSNINIPVSLENVGNDAFKGCKLLPEDITIGFVDKLKEKNKWRIFKV